MDFHKLLFSIGEELAADDLEALKFLCLDLIPLKKQETIQDALGLFWLLQEKGRLEVGKLSFLKELLFRIHRIDLLTTHLGTSQEDVSRELEEPGRAQVSAYRVLLFTLSDNVTRDELKSITFLLSNELPKSRLDNKTLMGIFIEMEKKGILGENNLDILKEICDKIDKTLLGKIDHYEERRAVQGLSSGFQEMSDARGEQGSQPQKNGDFYKMNSNPRGYCLIINNYNFQQARAEVPKLKKMKNRDGTDKDAEALRQIFKALAFLPVVLEDQTANQILETLQRFQRMDHSAQDCFVCCILSHGNRGVVYGTDGQQASICSLTSYFTGSRCPTLAGKPKLFFIQACQGDAYHLAVALETDTGPAAASPAEPDAVFHERCIPDEADFLLGMATVSNCVSYRVPSTGTWYIQSLCHHLRNLCPLGDDILTILTKVNFEVSQKIDLNNRGKQMPQPMFTLRKKLVLPPL
ncbi:caspase-8-like [Tachyglossus aculeatus]|uniref:caspase-8-like n=1 Tax=Tachyglossus aculeatus TaxID=9261 RepID=UPI0018F30FB3|nr:caspase-8-like [Tachyglossus aculeatus]